jgi:diphthamide synthase (EF-2-diphthine--ammonia ligase)
MKQVIVSWSGGKDSCLVCYKAMMAGYEVSYLTPSFLSLHLCLAGSSD